MVPAPRLEVTPKLAQEISEFKEPTGILATLRAQIETTPPAELRMLQAAINERRAAAGPVGPVPPELAQLELSVNTHLTALAAAAAAPGWAPAPAIPMPAAAPSAAVAPTPIAISTVPGAPVEPTNWTAETMKYGGMAVDAVSGVAKEGYKLGKSTVVDAIPTAQAEYEAVKEHAQRGDYIRAGVRSIPTVIAGGIAVYCGWNTIKNAWHAVVAPEGQGGLWARTKNLFKALGWTIAGVFGAGLIMKGTKHTLQGEAPPEAPKPEELAKMKASLETQIRNLPSNKTLMDDYLKPGLDVQGLCRLNSKGLAVNGQVAISAIVDKNPVPLKLTSVTHPAGTTNLQFDFETADGEKKSIILDTDQLARILADLQGRRSVKLDPAGFTNKEGKPITIVMGPEAAPATAATAPATGAAASKAPSTGPLAPSSDTLKEAGKLPENNELLAGAPVRLDLGSGHSCTIGNKEVLIDDKKVKLDAFAVASADKYKESDGYKVTFFSIQRVGGQFKLVFTHPDPDKFGLMTKNTEKLFPVDKLFRNLMELATTNKPVLEYTDEIKKDYYFRMRLSA